MKWNFIHFPGILCLIFMLLCQLDSTAQNHIVNRRSQKFFDKALLAYRLNQQIESAIWLKKAIDADSMNLDAYRLLSDVSDETNNLQQKKQALSKIVQIDQAANQNVLVSLAVLYQQSGEFNQALQVWEMLFQRYPDHQLAREQTDRCKALIKLIQHPLKIEIVQLNSPVNTKTHEYWPLISFDDSTLYFTRLMTSDQHFIFERLFYAYRTKTGWSEAQQLKFGDNELVNEGTLTMTADGRLIFFSACGRSGGMGSCDLYYFILQNGKWTGPRNAGTTINSKHWEAQPSVSANGRQLYFSSNRPGGFGSRDLWVSKISENQRGELEFSAPVNLGYKVNTAFDDFSPFIHADNQTLYFASEGHLNFGKSDVFIARLVNEQWDEVENLGVPVNSPASDDGLVVSPTANVAVFASDREGSIQQSKDLYQFQMPEQFLPQRVGYVKGKVYNAETLENLEAVIRLVDLEDHSAQEINATTNSGYLAILKERKTYAFLVEKSGYLLYSKHFNLMEPGTFVQATVMDIYLEPISKDLRMVLSNVFFDLDSHIIQSASFPELDELIRFLKLNATLKIEISGHTDNTGQSEYNRELSLKRADSIAKYLQNEIDAERIVVAGYGADMPLESNETEAGRSKNRRCELRILSQ
jgi:outer membrane protein OmpA-like peptidoglycan-associated protein/tetratricopeptide (TPR) repeat protein